MTAADGEPFGRFAFEVVPRVLGLCDRKDESPTAGCCDRSFWHYCTIDSSNARTQEAGWLFALVTLTPSSPYAGNPRLVEWSRLAWRYWLRTRNRDGSAHEVYPYERSFCATSFGAAAFMQTILVLGGPRHWQEEVESLRTTINWLAAHENLRVANQVAASLEALAIYANLTGEKAFSHATQSRLRSLLKMRDADGFFSEYGGVDLGYQTITMASLVRTLPFLKNAEEVEVLLKNTARLYFDRCDEVALWDSSKNSRKTQFLYPSAFLTLCPAFLDRIVAGLNKGVLLRPGWMDDRYCTAFTIDYLLTHRGLAGRALG